MRRGMEGIFAIILLLRLETVQADLMVSPNSAATTPAIGAQIPFAVSGGRYLNIYNATEFLSSMPNGGRITGMAFRLDESEQESFSARIPEIEVRLSTSPSVAPVIPLPFSANIGSDETVVFRGAVDRQLRASGTGPNLSTSHSNLVGRLITIRGTGV
jgi:hypothetical protein